MEEQLIDLQVGGQALDDVQFQVSDQFENLTLPQIKLERLALELNHLEEELNELGKDDIPGAFSDENEVSNQIQEVNLLREEMYKILGSEAFQHLEGKTKIEQLLEKGTQDSV